MRFVIEPIGYPGFGLGMAWLALHPPFPTIPIELAPVHVAVADGAGPRCLGVVPRAGEIGVLLMTLGTGHGPVGTGQGIDLVMLGRAIVDRQEMGLPVTIRAGGMALIELPTVGIRVAIPARVSETHERPYLPLRRLLMTGSTGNLRMRRFQRKTFVVVRYGDRAGIPLRLRVAIRAGGITLGELTPVRILMTADTVPQLPRVARHTGIGITRSIGEIRCVAFFTGHTGVSGFQGETGTRMRIQIHTALSGGPARVRRQVTLRTVPAQIRTVE